MNAVIPGNTANGRTLAQQKPAGLVKCGDAPLVCACALCERTRLFSVKNKGVA